MTVDEFIALCKEKIEAYIDDSSTEYTIYTLWKDYWTVGSNTNSVRSIANQRGIFGTTLDNSLYDITYSEQAGKLYMNVLTQTDTETYDYPETPQL